MTTQDHPVGEMIEATTELLEEDSISVADVVEDLGHSSMSATLLLPAMAVVSPLSGVPLFSTVCGMLIFLIAAQMTLGRDHLWLPDWLRRQRVSSDRARKVLGPMRRMARFLDRHTEARVKMLLRQPFLTIPRVICALCGLAMPFLELVPFSSSTLGIVVSSLAVAMLTRDGLVMLVALLLLTAAGVGLPYLLI
ncbi:exopolysaccharide biosynthesis protein [Phaeobacter porticola]|uniref:Putative exopolysaccharide synthesis protein ExoD n=1 Tax=Phaeobacter porticola TaxID=1844006 RepID=A0A1L3I792_9RHOB|nr:exopolysaccharide biosynthesis protein [Phaeobacter porticola]APG48018.1 putative exopolysaccharide synthesis protein ExoD [Phaeobacter porticola]